LTEVVVDASVAAKWVVWEDHSTKAATLLAYDARHAPDYWRPEVVNVLWSKVFRRELTAADAEERMKTLLRALALCRPGRTT
jgi:predicted nucleic acid-binding protein